MDNDIEFRDKFIGFIDILGFKNLVDAAESGIGISLVELLETVQELGKPEDRLEYEKYGPMTCPESRYVQRHLDFRLTQISDCVVLSTEVSPAGVINLIKHCWGAVIKLLAKGIMCRGYITRGSLYHSDTQIIGSGYQEAYRKEAFVTAFKREADERGTPFVEVNTVVCGYVRDHGDKCVKEMFARFIKEDGTVTALFPFQRLQHSFIIGDLPGRNFNPEEERQSNKNMRSMIENMKERVKALVDSSNSDAVSKAEHYIAALENQIEVCKKAEEMINMLVSSFPKR